MIDASGNRTVSEWVDGKRIWNTLSNFIYLLINYSPIGYAIVYPCVSYHVFVVP